MSKLDELPKEAIILCMEKIKNEIRNTSNKRKLIKLSKCMKILSEAYGNFNQEAIKNE